ncbi:2-C-methyl-D-erythritol 4-phosphate cytidylyltransferase [Candidatus Woesearchaeota archaeon]|nr:2-C-methyl-D-erythritol 4-phosphate cytidylyltransferase [Candidatus Woesearchaeota archaeon]
MNIAIIVGAGKGKRMNSKVNKILLSLVDKPIICHTIEKFENCAEIDSIILVVNKDNLQEMERIVEYNCYEKVIKVIEGGEKRQDSVYNAIREANHARPNDIILVHNAANPIVSEETIKKVIKAAKDFGAAAVAIKARDTIKQTDEDNFVDITLEREKLWCMQTPQAIKYGLAVKAFIKAYNDEFYGTDDVSLVERLGNKVKIIESNIDNIKITTKEDIEFANSLFSKARVGLGQDSHRFSKKGRPLILGGVLIGNEQGLEANSDGDVILHALCNALSQAIGGKSLGYYADPMFEKGIKDSKEYLKKILMLVRNDSYIVNNVGIMVEAKKPRLENYEEQIKENIADLINIKKENVGLAVTSGEELTDFGKGLGIQCFAVTSLTKKQD